MNISVYMFGEFENGYTQYPDDNTAQIFHTFHKNTTSTSQISIHRDGNLMYYGYVRKLEYERYIGFCVVLNGVFLKELNDLFGLYENLVSYLVINGKLINFNQQGEIVTNADKLYLNKETIDIVADNLRAGFLRIKSSVEVLPPVNYGIGKDTIKEYTIDDELSDIINSSYTYGYTFVRKDKGCNTSQMNSYKGVLVRINNEKEELQERCQLLSEEIEELNKEKKQYKVVMLLGLVLLACCAGLWFFFDKLNITEGELADAQSTISVQSDSIQMKNGLIDEMYEENANITRLYNQERSKLRISQDSLSVYKKALPDSRFTITSTSFNFSSGYYTVNYYGLENLDNVEFVVRVFDDNGSLVKTTSLRQNIYSGANTFDCYINHSLSYNRWYTFVVLQGNKVVGGSKH